MRRHLQREIERDLLGRTTDAKREVLIEDSEEAQARLVELEIETAVRDRARRLYEEYTQTLTPENQAILLAERGGLRKIAEAQGKTYEAVKKQHGRLWTRFVARAKGQGML